MTTTEYKIDNNLIKMLSESQAGKFNVLIRTIPALELNSYHARRLSEAGVELHRKTNIYQASITKSAIESLAEEDWVVFIALKRKTND